MSAMWARPGGPEQAKVQLSTPSPAAMQLLQVNTHVDPVAWGHDHGFIGENEALEQLVCHLRLRRKYPLLGDEPTGLLSHHLVQTDSVWDFCEEFIERINSDNNCRWLGAREIWQ